MSILTASRLDLARHCPGFAALPHVDTPTPEAEAGSDKHDQQDAAIKGGKVPAIYRERWPQVTTWRSEVKFAVDAHTGFGRELFAPGTRNYRDATRTEVPGTADVVGIGPEVVVVVDKKSYDPNIPRAAVNAQVHIAALAFASIQPGLPRRVFVAIDHEVRGLDVAQLDAFDLAAFASELREIRAGVLAQIALAKTGYPPKVTEGPWCRWCPAFHACPAKAALRDQAAGAIAKMDAGLAPVPFLDDDTEAARAYEFSNQLGILKRRIDAAIYARAKDRPIPLGNGRMLGPMFTEGNEKLDGDTVYNVVKEKHGQGIADAAVLRSATKKRLDEAMSFAGVKSRAAACNEVLAEVRKRGGARKDTKETIDEYPADAPALEAAK